MPGIEQFPILIVHSGDRHNPAIGTGFVVHREQDHDLVLTCGHVVQDVGGSDSVRVDTFPASVVALDDPGRLDLAVLRVAGHPPAEPLRLAAWAELNGRYRILGFYQASGDSDSATAASADVQLVSAQGRRLQGDRELTPLWGFSTRGDVAPTTGTASAFNRVYGGFSGGPVLDPDTGRVVAIVMEILPEEGRSGGGTGRVIDIRCLRSLWPGMPETLSRDLLEKPAADGRTAPPAGGDIRDAIRQVHETLKTINALKILHETLHRHRQPLKQLEDWIARQGEGDGPDFPEEARMALELLKLELESLRRDERIENLDGATLEHGWHRRLHSDVETFLDLLGEPGRPGPMRAVTRAGREVIRTVDANFPRLNRDLITQIGTLDLQPLIARIESSGADDEPLEAIARTLREISGERGRLLRLGKVHDDWQVLDERITNLMRTLGGLVRNPAGDQAGEDLLGFLSSLAGHLDTFEQTLEHLCSPEALSITEKGMYRFLIEKAATNAIKQVRQLRLVAGDLGEPSRGTDADWRDDQREALASCNRYLDGLFHQVNNGFQKVDTELMEESNRLVLHSPLRDLLELRP